MAGAALSVAGLQSRSISVLPGHSLPCMPVTLHFIGMDMAVPELLSKWKATAEKKVYSVKSKARAKGVGRKRDEWLFEVESGGKKRRLGCELGCELYPSGSDMIQCSYYFYVLLCVTFSATRFNALPPVFSWIKLLWGPPPTSFLLCLCLLLCPSCPHIVFLLTTPFSHFTIFFSPCLMFPRAPV